MFNIKHLGRLSLNYVMFMLNSNDPIKIAHLQKLANQLMLNGALVIEMVNNSFSENKKNFGRFIKRELSNWKKQMWAVKNKFPIVFAKYLSY